MNAPGNLANEYAEARIEEKSGTMSKRLIDDAFEEVKGLLGKSRVEEYSAEELVEFLER